MTARDTIWDVKLGADVTTLVATDFVGLACGSDGGPPLQQLSSWTDYPRCEAEGDGLRDVYFEYDRSAEAAARVSGQFVPYEVIGTAESYFPVVASVLVDPQGRIAGVRLVTDPRPDEQRYANQQGLRPRGEHYLLGLYLMERLGLTDADCRDEPLAAGESPVIGMVVNRVCSRADGVAKDRIEQRFFRKRGQRDVDQVSGELTEGEFESTTRAQITLLPQ